MPSAICPTRLSPGSCRLVLLASLLLSPVLFAAEVADSLEVVEQTHRDSAASQRRIDNLDRETAALLAEYRRLQDGSDYEAARAQELLRLQQVQQQQIDDLRAQIAVTAATRQRIVPLMRSMAAALEQFVLLDLPFHREQRLDAVLRLQQTLDRPDLSVAARLHALLEAYQVELDYSYGIESWRATLEDDGAGRSVAFLRIGRLALYYQQLDGGGSGYWDRDAGRWLRLDSTGNRAVGSALGVARNEAAPALLTLPLLRPGVE